MSENDDAPRDNPEQPPKGTAGTAWENSGSVVDRAKSPTPTTGEGADAEASAEAERIGTSQRVETFGGFPVESGEEAYERQERIRKEPRAGHLEPPEATRPVHIQEPRKEDVDPRAARRTERVIALMLLLSAVASVAFAVVLLFYPFEYGEDYYWLYTPLLGLLLFVALFGIGAAGVHWAKRLMPDEEAVQEREPFASPADERAATEEVLVKGFTETGLGRRKLITGSLFASVGALGLTLVAPLLTFAPWQHKERKLATTPWRRGTRLVRIDGTPVRLGDLRVGGYETVFPEGHIEAADGPTMLIRLPPGVNEPDPGRENWAVGDHVAYSKICTHAGCPVGLYEQQTHYLLCPCHQSMFDVPRHCKVLFGPATRSLPQLAIAVDDEGYFFAQGDYSEPIGPSYWERNPSYPERPK